MSLKLSVPWLMGWAPGCGPDLVLDAKALLVFPVQWTCPHVLLSLPHSLVSHITKIFSPSPIFSLLSRAVSLGYSGNLGKERCELVNKWGNLDASVGFSQENPLKLNRELSYRKARRERFWKTHWPGEWELLGETCRSFWLPLFLSPFHEVSPQAPHIPYFLQVLSGYSHFFLSGKVLHNRLRNVPWARPPGCLF